MKTVCSTKINKLATKVLILSQEHSLNHDRGKILQSELNWSL